MNLSNYPPGFNGHFPWDDPYYCEVCGNLDDNCVCPECPVCGEYGYPECYRKHGMVMDKAQRICLEYWAGVEIDEIARENEMWAEEERERQAMEDYWREEEMRQLDERY